MLGKTNASGGGAKINADTYDYETDGTVNTGDFVNFVNGYVKGSSLSVLSDAYDYAAVEHIDDNRLLLAYATSSGVYACVITKNADDTFVAGTPTLQSEGVSNYTPHISVISSTRAVISWDSTWTCYFRLLTISENTVSPLGTALSSYSSTDSPKGDVCVISATKAFVRYNRSDEKRMGILNLDDALSFGSYVGVPWGAVTMKLRSLKDNHIWVCPNKPNTDTTVYRYYFNGSTIATSGVITIASGTGTYMQDFVVVRTNKAVVFYAKNNKAYMASLVYTTSLNLENEYAFNSATSQNSYANHNQLMFDDANIANCFGTTFLVTTGATRVLGSNTSAGSLGDGSAYDKLGRNVVYVYKSGTTWYCSMYYYNKATKSEFINPSGICKSVNGTLAKIYMPKE